MLLNKPSEITIAYDAGFSQSDFDGVEFILPIRQGINPNDQDENDKPIAPYQIDDSVYVEIYSITHESYNFLNEVITQTDRPGGFGELFATPLANVSTNINKVSGATPVVGFFNVSSVSALGQEIQPIAGRIPVVREALSLCGEGPLYISFYSLDLVTERTQHSMDYSGETPALHEGVDKGPDKQGRPAEAARVWKRLSVTAFFFVQGLAFATWASRIPDIKRYLQVDDGIWGNVLFALPLGLMVSLPISGWLVTHYGSRKMVIAGAILYALTLIGIGFAPGMWYLVGALFLFGLWGNLVNIAVNTQAIGVETLYGESIMASFHGAWSLAGFAGAAAAQVMVIFQVPTEVHFVFVSCTSLVLMFFFYRNLLTSGARASAQPVFVKA